MEYLIFYMLGIFVILNSKRSKVILVVTITTDEFVNKGPNRPVFDENLEVMQ